MLHTPLAPEPCYYAQNYFGLIQRPYLEIYILMYVTMWRHIFLCRYLYVTFSQFLYLIVALLLILASELANYKRISLILRLIHVSVYSFSPLFSSLLSSPAPRLVFWSKALTPLLHNRNPVRVTQFLHQINTPGTVTHFIAHRLAFVQVHFKIFNTGGDGSYRRHILHPHPPHPQHWLV